MVNTSLFIQSCLNQNTSGKIPVWMMRQAGRYLPEYQVLRKKYGFKQMMSTPELATEITLQPIRRFGMDAAILFSDILVTAEALGFPVEFIEKKGPVFHRPFTPNTTLPQHVDVPFKLSYVFDAIKLLKKELRVPLIGFAGAPFTVASYLIEGGSSASLEKVKKWMIDDPKSLHHLLSSLTSITKSYLEEQIRLGVDAVQLFDTWAGLLSHASFKTFALPYIKEIVRNLSCPVLFYTRHTSAFLDLLKDLPIQVLSVDWQSCLSFCRKNVAFSLQGNLDPQLLLGQDHNQIFLEVSDILDKMQGNPGYIFNLGHGVLPPTSPDTVKAIVDFVHAY